jgi:predicted nucleic acid-binding protein
MPGNFFDSNVALYAAAGDPEKAPVARELTRKGGVISVQVLNEVATVSLRKFGLSLPEVLDVLNRLRSAMTVVPVSVEIHDTALVVFERYRFAFYDCCIVAAALLADCDTLWSEDMHDGLVIDGRLTIRNPFAA